MTTEPGPDEDRRFHQLHHRLTLVVAEEAVGVLVASEVPSQLLRCTTSLAREMTAVELRIAQSAAVEAMLGSARAEGTAAVAPAARSSAVRSDGKSTTSSAENK